jgi:hypothetical protein
MTEKIPVMAFKCPNKRRKGTEDAECSGIMACQLLDSREGKFLVYCAKCGIFYLATAQDGIYKLTKVNKNNILFINQPVVT